MNFWKSSKSAFFGKLEFAMLYLAIQASTCITEMKPTELSTCWWSFELSIFWNSRERGLQKHPIFAYFAKFVRMMFQRSQQTESARPLRNVSSPTVPNFSPIGEGPQTPAPPFKGTISRKILLAYRIELVLLIRKCYYEKIQKCVFRAENYKNRQNRGTNKPR